MNYFSNRKKWMAYLILLTFMFTCIVPTNIVGGNEAWADTAAGIPMKATAENTIVSAGAESGITFKMFDYDKNINWLDATSGTFRPIASYFTFRGAEGEVSEGKPKMPTFVNYTDINGKEVKSNINNLYDEDGFTLNHATVERTLDANGYPVLNLTRKADGSARVDPGLSYENRKLDYLFKAGDHAVSAYTANNTLLKYNESTGEYSYNSKDNAVDFNCDTREFLVRNYTERSKSTTNYANSSPYWDFLPFTYSTTGMADETNKDETETKDSNGNVIKTPAVGYGLQYNYDINPNYWYGMTMETHFRQPAGGKVGNDREMVFSFSGDDDVWVFIDNVLVLDLGGTHGVVSGSINFATGAVTQHIDWAGDTGTKKYHWNAAKNQTEACVTTGENACNGCGGYVKSYPPTTIKACFDEAQQTNTVDWKGNTFADNTKHTLKFFYLERGSGSANCAMNFNLQVSETAKTVEKVWDDDSNRDGLRPNEVDVQLFANGQTMGSAITLDVTNNWTYTWTELEKYDDAGQEIVYTVKELLPDSETAIEESGAFNDDYDKVTYVTNETTGAVTITNYHEPEKITIEGKKYWEHGDNPEENWPDKITVNLFSDEENKIVATQEVTSASSWTFKFDNLPKYKNHGADEIKYRVLENEVTNYQPVYDKDGYDITNVYTENATPYVTIGGEKIWQGDENDLTKRPENVKVDLFQNNSTDPIATTVTALDWTFSFDEQPRYDSNGKPYVYTVKELNVPEGYISMTEESDDASYDFAFDITNILHTGEVGKVNVKKVVSGDGAPDEFNFVLSVTAKEYILSDEVKDEQERLELAYQNAVAAESEAQENWKEAVTLFKKNAGAYSTSSAYQFVMVKQTSPSVYQFTTLDKESRMEVTTSSALSLFDGMEPVSNSDSVLTGVANAIGGLADDFKNLTDRASVFLKALQNALGDTVDAAIEFRTEDAQTLLDAQNKLFDAKVRVEATSSAVYEFVESNTTPSAVTIITKAASGTETTHNMTLDKLSDAKTYRLDFSLKNNQEYSATILAAEGVELDYTVWEQLTDEDRTNYEKTVIELNDGKVGEFTTGNPSYTSSLTDAEVADLVFTNYYKTTAPWTPNTTNPETPPPTIPPGTTITDPDVPTGTVEVPGEPLDELNDPEIPLGDAPATGDNSNAVPFVVLMMLAMAGLVITRRKFN